MPFDHALWERLCKLDEERKPKSPIVKESKSFRHANGSKQSSDVMAMAMPDDADDPFAPRDKVSRLIRFFRVWVYRLAFFLLARLLYGCIPRSMWVEFRSFLYDR
jgi:hypothetical protein